MASPTELSPDFKLLIQLAQHQPAIIQHILGGAARGLYPTEIAVAIADSTEQLRDQYAARSVVQRNA